MKLEKGNYAIGLNRNKIGKPKPFLFKINSVSRDTVIGVLEKNRHIQKQKYTFELPIKDIIVSLGNDPHPGKVHGQDTSILYRGKTIHDDFGDLYWFYRPESTVKEDVKSGFKKAAKCLKQNRLDFLINDDNCVWEILPFNGEKYAGCYIRSKDSEKSPNRYQIRPEIMPSSEYPYVILHEIGHHFHHEYLTGKKINASWVRLYNTSIAKDVIKKDKLQELLEGLIEQKEHLPSEYKTILSEEDTQSYRYILKAINDQHSLSVKELDLLFEADYLDDIKAIWPKRDLSLKMFAPIVSQYACKSVAELIAESFSMFLLKKKLPDDVHDLLDKSLSHGRMKAK
jgi:hypothetical protein